MQLNTMDCSGRRSNNAERDSDLGDDLSHDDHTDDEMRDCDSVEGDHTIRVRRLNVSSNGADLSYGSAGNIGPGGVRMHVRSPDRHTELQMSHHHQYPQNHALNALGNFMGMGGLHGIPNLQHSDVLEKLKMQVRDMKVGLMEQDYAAHAATFGSNMLPTSMNSTFALPPTSMASYAQNMTASQVASAAANMPNGSASAHNNSANANTGSAATALTNGGGVGGGSGSAGGGTAAGAGGSGGSSSSFSFTSPTAPSTKDVNPASNSSTSSEASNSSQQNNGWSFEEQYKQVRQLYEINDDPKRKEFLDDLFSFMQKRGTPINRLPIMAKSVLDLYELYNLVIARGGLVDVINKKLWQEIIKGLHLPSSITSAAFTLRTQYMKYLYPYECDKKNLSTPAELQAAIDGNRREGRRSSYGQYEAMHSSLQLPAMARQALPGGMQQMSPLALVTHAANNQQVQAQAAAAAAAAHHRLMAPTFGQMPNLVTHEFEQRMMEYLKLIQAKKEHSALSAGGVGASSSSALSSAAAVAAHSAQQQRQRSQSPEIPTREAMNALEMSRVALWQMYNSSASPPASLNASPQGLGGAAASAAAIAEQRSEALNLSESPPHLNNIKREREREPSPEPCERDDFQHQPPPTKRAGNGLNFPAGFYLPTTLAAAAAAVGVDFRHSSNNNNSSIDMHSQQSDGEDDDESNVHNLMTNAALREGHDSRQTLNGKHLHHQHQHEHHNLGGGGGGGSNGNNSSHHHDKSDDSAIENSPSTSGASTGGGVGGCHISPVSTKKIHLSKSQLHNSNGGAGGSSGGASDTLGAVEALSLLSGMQFRVARNGTNENGDSQLIVNLELNGIKYSGVLIANTSSGTEVIEKKAKAETAECLQSSALEKSGSDERSEDDTVTEEAATDSSAEDTPSKVKATNATMVNGPASATLKDTVTTT